MPPIDYPHACLRRRASRRGNNAGGVEQTFATTIGQTYKVSFELAGNPDGGPATKELLTSTVGGVNTFNFNTSGTNDSNMNWTTESFEFTANSTSTLLSFVSLNNGYYGPALDAVDVEAVLRIARTTPTDGCPIFARSLRKGGKRKCPHNGNLKLSSRVE